MQQRFPTVSEIRTLSKGFFGRFVCCTGAAMLLYGLAIALALLPMGLGMLRVLSPRVVGDVHLDRSTTRWSPRARSGAAVGLLIALVAAAAFVVEVKLAYVMQVCALENLSGMAALRRAWDITREAFWRTLGYLLVFGLAAGAAQQVVSVAGQAHHGLVHRDRALVVLVVDLHPGASSRCCRAAPDDRRLGVYVVMVLVQLVLVPLKLVYVTVMYRDQVRRRELGPVAHAFGMNVPGQPVYAGQPMPGYYGTPGQPPQYGQAHRSTARRRTMDSLRSTRRGTGRHRAATRRHPATGSPRPRPRLRSAPGGVRPADLLRSAGPAPQG